MGLSEGLIRFSVGLDNDIELSFERIKRGLSDIGVIQNRPLTIAFLVLPPQVFLRL